MALPRAFLVVALCSGLGAAVAAHNIGATPVTWNREISRLVYDKCASCHRPGGTAFSMMTYADVQPRVVEIKTAVLSRRMPPWGAIKGFGEFRNDQALTQEQIELVVDWIQNDAPRGNNRRALPAEPTFAATPPYQLPARTMPVKGTATLSRCASSRRSQTDPSSRWSGFTSTTNGIGIHFSSGRPSLCRLAPSSAVSPMMPSSN